MSTIETTKVCPNCGLSFMVGLQTYFIKVCSVCNTEVPWTTTKGQKPLLTGKLYDKCETERRRG